MDKGKYLIECNKIKQLLTPTINKISLKSKNLPYFLPDEVVVHNTSDDCWVSFLEVVRNLTPLIIKYDDSAKIKPILANAGKDISHWFNKRTGDIRHFIHPITGVKVPFCQHGPVPDVGVQVPSTEWQPFEGIPWWFDHQYIIGLLTEHPRSIRIKNMLTGQENVIKVCCEDSIYRIEERYNMFNNHSTSYTWKFETNILDKNLTLEENNIPDLRFKFKDCTLPDMFYTSCLMLYFNDDLT
uniref:Cytochrome b5 heme-binding domain-containing protein n=1 Tax=Clastoptera arizonana TaxID=38151 RepID=A0A1B6CNF8_9HEMI